MVTEHPFLIGMEVVEAGSYMGIGMFHDAECILTRWHYRSNRMLVGELFQPTHIDVS